MSIRDNRCIVLFGTFTWFSYWIAKRGDLSKHTQVFFIQPVTFITPYFQKFTEEVLRSPRRQTDAVSPGRRVPSSMIFPGRLLLGRLRSPTSAPALWQMINSKMWALCRCSGGPMLLDARPLHRSPLAVC